MLPDPLLESMNSTDKDVVCNFFALKPDDTLMYKRKYIIIVCGGVCVEDDI